MQGWDFTVQNLIFPSKMVYTWINMFFLSKTGENCPKPGKNYGGLYLKQEKEWKMWCVKLKLNNEG